MLKILSSPVYKPVLASATPLLVQNTELNAVRTIPLLRIQTSLI